MKECLASLGSSRAAWLPTTFAHHWEAANRHRTWPSGCHRTKEPTIGHEVARRDVPGMQRFGRIAGEDGQMISKDERRIVKRSVPQRAAPKTRSSRPDRPIAVLVILSLFLFSIVPGSAVSASAGPWRQEAHDRATTSVVRTFQENHQRIVFSGLWKRADHPGYSKGRASSSRQAGARFKLRFSGTAVSWIGPVGPTRGKARVYIDGRFVKTVDAYSASFRASRVLFTWTSKASKVRTITVEVLGTRGRPTVSIDALVTRGGANPTPQAEPSPTPRTDAYGSVVGGDVLANTLTSEGPVSLRFIPDRSGPLSGVRVYFEVGTGYSGGDGGSRRITIETDTGGKPSGTVLATAWHSGLPGEGSADRFVTFSLPATLEAGRAYHVVFTNSGGGHISVNALLVWQPDPVGQPKFSGWQVLRNGIVRNRFLPILELQWSDGARTGTGYINSWWRLPVPVGGADRAREWFIPQTDVTFSEVWVRVMKDGDGNGAPLRVTLAGQTILIPATSVPNGTATGNSAQRSAWVGGRVEQTTIRAGTAQALELSADSGISYRAESLQKGADYGFSAYFQDGHAQRSMDGGQTWRGVPAWSSTETKTTGDLQWFVK